MALTTAELLRRHIADRPRLAVELYYGDGTASSFGISGSPIVTGCTALGAFQPSAMVPVGNSWSATGATFDYNLGTVTFSGVISANSAFQVVYTYGTFSDQEIDQVTATYGILQEMQLDLIDTLMADSYKRARWASQRGAYFDDSLTMNNLMLMRSAVFASKTTEQGPLGGIVGWSNTQSVNG
jgi:hypothetical protein